MTEEAKAQRGHPEPKREMTPDEVLKRDAKILALGWQRYITWHGEAPHGSEKQMAALLELSGWRKR